MKKTRLVFVSIVLFVLLGSFGMKASAQGGDSLYKRLGGYDALAAVTDDFIMRLVADKTLGRFFGGASDNSKMRIRQLVVDRCARPRAGLACTSAAT